MEKLRIYLVKPFPSKEVRERKCPTPEKYKYAWEPIALKYFAYHLNEMFGEVLDVKIWHLINDQDKEDLLLAIKHHLPGIVAFTELDVLVNETNKLAEECKAISNDIITLCGGKQSSLLRQSDTNPFSNIDYIIRGDGVNGLASFVQRYLANEVFVFDGLLNGQNKSIVEEDTFCKRLNTVVIDFNAISQFSIENHPYEEYLDCHQFHPSIIKETINVRTAPLLTGTGCPYQCFFCQSPVEYNNSKVILNEVSEIAKHIVWQNKNYAVNNFFSLEPNLNLTNLFRIYDALEPLGIDYMSISGFIRAADIISAHKQGYLKKLVKKGMRILSIGLDVPFSKEDSYNKSFTYAEMMECLDLCFDYGIIVLATVVGDPTLTKEQFYLQLESLKALKVAEVDIRLAIALRNTEFYKVNEDQLIFHPEKDKQYFDKQNYRYQTLQFEGKITPEETYAMVNEFNDAFLCSEQHGEYVKTFTEKHPETMVFFKKQKEFI